jgi:hypothetical protein
MMLPRRQIGSELFSLDSFTRKSQIELTRSTFLTKLSQRWSPQPNNRRATNRFFLYKCPTAYGSSRLEEHAPPPAPRETLQGEEDLSSHVQLINLISKEAGTPHQTPDINSTSKYPSSPPLQNSSESEKPGPHEEPGLRQAMQTSTRSDLQWWTENVSLCNGRNIATPQPDLVLTSDASREGWGTTCKERHTGSMWSVGERAFHINFLELKAAFLAFQVFASQKSNAQHHRHFIPPQERGHTLADTL